MHAPALSVLGAFLGLNILGAHANVACTASQHLGDSVIPQPALAKALDESLHNSTNGPCDADFSAADFFIYRTESIVFTITRSDQDGSLESCEDSFDAIIRQCIEENNAHGGSLLANGFLYEIYHDDTVDDHLKQRANPVPAAKPPAKPPTRPATNPAAKPASPAKSPCSPNAKGKGGRLRGRAGSDCEDNITLHDLYASIPSSQILKGDSAHYERIDGSKSITWGITYLYGCTAIVVTDPKFFIIAHMQQENRDCIQLTDKASLNKFLTIRLAEATDLAVPGKDTKVYLLYRQPKVGQPLLGTIKEFLNDEMGFEGEVNVRQYSNSNFLENPQGPIGKAAVQVIGGKGKGKNKMKVFFSSDTPIGVTTF